MDSGGRLFKLSERPDTRQASGAHEALGYHERNWVAASLPLHTALTEEALRETHLAHFVVVCMPGRFGLRTLDATMAAAHAWDERWRQDVRPAFYDWEAKRWIRASRWIPARARRNQSGEGASPP